MNKNIKSKPKNNRKNKPRKNNNNESSGFLRPFPASRLLNLMVKTDGPLQAAAPFLVVESRLMSLAGQGFLGGTGTLTTSITGLIDASAYALGRALNFKFEASIVSAEGVQIDAITLILSDTQPSTVITSYALAQSATINYLHTKTRKLGIVSGNPVFQMNNLKTSPRQIVKDNIIADDRDFVCTLFPAAANAAQELWAAFILTSTTAATNLTTGVDITVTIQTRYKAFSRLPGT